MLGLRKLSICWNISKEHLYILKIKKNDIFFALLLLNFDWPAEEIFQICLIVKDGYHYKSPVTAIIKRVNKDSVNEYIVFLMSKYSSRG